MTSNHHPVLRSSSLFLILSLFLFTVGPTASRGAPLGTLEFSTPQRIVFTWGELGIPSDATDVAVIEPPTRGSIGPFHGGNLLSFEPDLEFWSLGHDRFEVRWSDERSAHVASVLVVAADPPMGLLSSFEEGEILPVSAVPLDIGRRGALVGSRGFYQEISPTTPFSQGAFDWQALGLELPIEPEGNASSGEIHVTLDTPPGGGEGAVLGEGFWSLFGATDESGNLVASVRVGHSQYGETLLQGQLGPTAESLAEVEQFGIPVLGSGVHRIRFHAWTFHPAGFRMWVDDRAMLEIDGTDLDLEPLVGLAFGHLDGAPTQEGRLKIDHVKFAGTKNVPRWRRVIADDFDGDLAGWDEVSSSLSPGTGPSVSKGALHLPLGGSAAGDMYVGMDAPAKAVELSLRGSFDTSQLTMGAGDHLALFTAYSGPPAVSLAKILLRPDGQDFKLRVSARDDAGVMGGSLWHTVTRGEHLLELRWRAATEAGVEDGYARLYVDGVFVADVPQLANAAHGWTQLRLGAQGVDPDTSGTLTFDDLVIWTEPLAPHPGG
ncbi:MAG: hypothetical protein AAGN66_21750 [Acidobacteriota bacterium]